LIQALHQTQIVMPDASASLTVTAIRVGSSEDSGTAGSIGSALTGTYGQLTIAANGSYSYVANPISSGRSRCR
jgi:hypothetical protein